MTKIIKAALSIQNGGSATVVNCNPETMRFGLQHGVPTVWYETGDYLLRLQTVFTGYAAPEGIFLDTLIDDNTNMVYHIYEVTHEPYTQPNLLPDDEPEDEYPAVDSLTLPTNGVVFYYKKKDGEVRLVRLNHIEFGSYGGRIVFNGYDHDAKAMRTFYADQIVNWPELI